MGFLVVVFIFIFDFMCLVLNFGVGLFGFCFGLKVFKVVIWMGNWIIDILLFCVCVIVKGVIG